MTAVDRITNASSANRYVVVIGPGVYTLPETLVMKPYVDIVGVGPNATVLQGGFSGSSANNVDAAVVSGASSAAISDLSIINTGGMNTASIALRNPGSMVSNVHVEVSGGNVQYGIYAFGASPSIENVSIDVSNGANNQYGLHFSSGQARISGIDVQM